MLELVARGSARPGNLKIAGTGAIVINRDGTIFQGDASLGKLAVRKFPNNAELTPLQEFILPGGSRAASCCHLARTIARRAERALVALAQRESVSALALQYLNRLSDFLFILSFISLFRLIKSFCLLLLL